MYRRQLWNWLKESIAIISQVRKKNWKTVRKGKIKMFSKNNYQPSSEWRHECTCILAISLGMYYSGCQCSQLHKLAYNNCEELYWTDRELDRHTRTRTKSLHTQNGRNSFKKSTSSVTLSSAERDSGIQWICLSCCLIWREGGGVLQSSTVSL